MQRYDNLHEYFAATGTKKGFVTKQLGISRFQMAGLLYPDRYPVSLSADLTRKIAVLLNQSETHVRKLYPQAA